MKKVQWFLFQWACMFVALCVASLVNLQWVIGARIFMFSASNIVAPLIGYVCPWVFLLAVCLKRFLGHAVFGMSIFTPCSSMIPTLCASWYWNIFSKYFRLLVPIACTVLFMMHPTGCKTFIPLYWSIPVILYFVRKKSIFLDALAATFMQHAVGSVIWLYSMPTTPELWHSLLPVIIVERCMFAAGITVGITCLRYIQGKVYKLSSGFKTVGSAV